MTHATDVLAELARRLASGESPQAIGRSLLPDHWPPVLRACAVARCFDSALYDEVLRPYAARSGSEPPTLHELIERQAVRPAPGEPGWYVLSEADRAAYFQEWFTPGDRTVPSELRELEAHIADLRRAAGDHTEEVRHLLLASPDLVLARFDELFTVADERRDFAACQDLVDVLGDPDRFPYADLALQQRLADRAGYVRARAYWAADYARSAQFLHPKGLLRTAERLLTGEQRVWQLYAPGGAGKTMQLRWLVARHCVPAKRDVLCARIDFDVVSAHAVGRHPWLLLLEVAEQFGRRLPGHPFERLEDYAAYRVLLDDRPSGPARVAAQDIASLNSKKVEEELLAAFAERLNRARPDRPAVLVVDTLEELLLHGLPEAEQLLRLLGRLLERCPGLRLVLAGRYDLRERLPKALKAFGRGQVRHSKVQPFGMAQARAYLTRVRGITDRKLIKLAARKAEGRPFHLALFADVIEQEPDITAEALDACDEPQVRYLIERVVRRIHDPAVRWLLRYGVIPRRLRLEDVTTVMRPWLARGITGTGGADDPLSDVHHLQGSPEVFPLAATAPTDEELEQAWRRLLEYASGSSWVSRHAGDDSVVVFHADVLEPMRQLISGQPVSRHLHHAFVEHFEALAETDPNQWVTYTKEAVYHRFQAGDSQAAHFWMGAVRRMSEQHRLEAVRELCKEVLGSEYVDEAEPRLRLDGKPLISHGTLAAAHLAIAAALANTPMDTETANPPDLRWNEIERRLALVNQLRERSPATIPAESAERILHAKILGSRNRHEEAEQVVRSALKTERRKAWREQLQVTLAQIQTELNNPEAETTYRTALETARVRGAEKTESLIALELAQQLKQQGRIGQAFELLDSVMAKNATPARNHDLTPGSALEDDRLASLRHRALLLTAHCQLQAHTPTAAMQTLCTLDPHTTIETHRVEACQLLARAQHLLGRAHDALATLDEADSFFRGTIGPIQYRYLARSMMMRGVIEGELLAVDRAESSFDRAASLYSDLGFPHGHPECLLLYARFLARDLGDLRRAASMLGQLQVADARGKWAVQRALLWHELDRQGYPVRDASLLDVPLRSRKDLLSGGVAAVLADPRRASDLTDVLATVQPPGARLSALKGLAWCPNPDGTADSCPTGLELLRPLFASVAQLEPANVDHHVQLARLAEFERVCGRRGSATQLTEQSHQGLRSSAPEEPLPTWRLARAQLRLGGVLDWQSHALCAEAPSDVPLLSAVARWLLASTEPGENKESLLRAAAEDLSRVHRSSVWATHILRSIAAVLDDESTRLTASRMAAHLGHPEPDTPGQPASAPARSDHERVITLAPRTTPEPSTDSNPMRMADVLLENWRDTASARSRLLKVRSRGRDPVASVQLQSDDVALHAFPWELVPPLAPAANGSIPYRTLPDAAKSADVRALQAALNTRAGIALVADGVWGTLTRAAVATAMDVALPKSMGNTSRTLLSVGVSTAMWGLMRESRKQARARYGARAVLLLHDGFGRYSAGTRRTQRSPLAAIYETHGCDVRQLRTPAALPSTRKGPPAMLHVSAPLRLKGGSTPYFDLSPMDLSHVDRLGSKASGSDLEPGRLVEWLAQFEPGTQPLVVLDPPRPDSPADIPLQLVLRNLFAATLFASGVAPAVIGTGLVRAAAHQAEVLAAGVGEDTPLLNLYDALRTKGAASADSSRSARTRKKDADWGDDVLESATASLFATPSALRVSEPDPEKP